MERSSAAHPIPSGAHAMTAGAHDAPGNAMAAAHHPKASLYVIIFVALFILTGLEVAVASPPLKELLPQLPLLLGLALLKGLTIVLFYMHLKFDSRVFSGFFALGLILAVGMILTFMALFTAHYREPFDEVAAKLAREQAAGGASGTAAVASTGH